MYLAFDTETTDLPRPHLEPDHLAQPHLLQFAGILFNDDGTELDRLFTMVRPGRGALLSTHAFAAHGISLEEAFHRGIAASEVFRWFATASRRSTCIVGHNIDFDLRMMTIVAARLGKTGWTAPGHTFCTMAHSTALVNLPPTLRMMAAGRFHPKSPTLSECVRHFFGEEHRDAHDAEADVRACIRIFRHLKTEKTAA
jgi:DNA polymerase-3 subunit epsilon